MDVWLAGTLNQLFMRLLYPNYWQEKTKWVVVKLRSLRYAHLVLPILFVLTLAINRAVLCQVLRFKQGYRFSEKLLQSLSTLKYI